MKKSTNDDLLENYTRIREAAAASEDGLRCLIAPSPELKKKLTTEMKKINKQVSDNVLANKIKLGTDYKPVGYNDGLIYPGSMFPAGTSAAMARNAAAAKAPLRGVVRVIVVLVDFSDKVMTAKKSYFEDLFFSKGKLATGSVNEYYKEVTNGAIDIQGQVVGPYRMPKTIAQYANGQSGTGSASPNARTMAKDAALAANAAINFVEYDNDKDGFVDAFIVVHAGRGGEETGSANDIWSHKWVLDGGAFTADAATRIYAYLTVPEDCRLGVCAHELGHLLFGFPDLYDTDYSSEGIGNWCLMAGGSWNNAGLTPAHPSAWCKCQQGWVTTVNQKTNQTKVPIEDVKTGFKVHRLWKDGAAGNEYFLLENRQKTLFDKYLPADGLLIWHIDDSVDTNSSEAHYKVALVQADNKKDLELNANRGDGGDVYPGTTGNKAFTNTSKPASKSYAGAVTNVSVTNISVPAAVMKADLAVKAVTKTTKKSKKEAPMESEEEQETLPAFIKTFTNDSLELTAKPAESIQSVATPPPDLGSESDFEERLSRLEAIVNQLEPAEKVNG